MSAATHSLEVRHADDQLLTITATSIDYITKRTPFEQTNRDIPQTVQSSDSVPRQEYQGPSDSRCLKIRAEEDELN